MTSSLRDLKVYTTYPHRCSYLEDEEATTLFIDPRQAVDKTLYSNLSLLGFRRSGNHIYRPHCEGCRACVPIRVPVHAFRPRRAQRRSMKINADLQEFLNRRNQCVRFRVLLLDPETENQQMEEVYDAQMMAFP